MMHLTGSTDDFLIDGERSRRRKSTRTLVVVGVLACLLGLGIGVLIGYFSRNVSEGSDSHVSGPCLGPDVPDKIIQDGEEGITEKIIQKVSTDSIRNFLRQFTTYPHLGGTKGEERLAEELAGLWRDQGLDRVDTRTYEVLLSYPDPERPSQAFLMNGDDILHATQEEEEILRPEQNHSDVIPPFNAYSPPGDIKGQLVYANYGRREDFQYLTEKNINLNGTIVICRYGKIFRGDKVKFAEQWGAAGILMYTDPADYSMKTSEGVYPDSWWLPPTGVQRGTVFAYDGDPLTPGYPSIDSAYRVSEDKAHLPQIPAHPISYGDAEVLLMDMGGPAPPDDWKGGLNVSYNLGPGFIDDNYYVWLNVTTHNVMANTTNVLGYIYGSVEPDRYVLLGNHRDAWVFGAVDPTSGTAAMVEASRVLMDLVKNENWRPRRTIVFCSWGAEEYALVGSQEWVEEFRANLGQRSIAYLNVDIAIQGNFSMQARGMPLLYEPLYEVAKRIETPNSPGKTLYQEWNETFPDSSTGKPSIGGIGAASDYAAFMILTGIPCLDVRYTFDRNNIPIIDYPLYHSVYETFHLVENFIDRDFKFTQAITIYWAEMARYLADSLMLPLDVSSYGEVLQRNVQDLEKGYGDMMSKQNITLDGLHGAVSIFQDAIKEFNERLLNVNEKNPAETRMINDQMMQLERAFLDPEGLPTRPLYKHIVFAPSSEDAYAGTTFPGLVDLMYGIDEKEDAEERWDAVRKHLSVLVFTIRSAASTLTDAKSTS